MSRERQKYSREDAIEVAAFERLILGALKIEDDEQRIRTIMIILCAGRLGLRASEIQHLHEGWIDWERGIIRVPAHEPCFCKWCLESAQGKVERERRAAKRKKIEKETGEEVYLDDVEVDVAIDDPEVIEYAYENQYEPKPGASARVVPFGWSKRITAYLMKFFDENEFLDITQQQMRNDVRKAARKAEGVNPSNLTPHPLRATGGTFYADAGLLPKPLRDIMGWSDLANAERYIRASGRQLTSKVYEIFGRGEWAPDETVEDPADEFPVACDPRPYASELDVDPRLYGPKKRRQRAHIREEEPERVYNPRRERCMDKISYDPDRHTIPGHVTPDGKGLEEPDVERDGDLREWVDYQNEQTDTTAETADRRPGVDSYGDNDELEKDIHDPITATLRTHFSLIKTTVEPWISKKWENNIGFSVKKWTEKSTFRKGILMSLVFGGWIVGFAQMLAADGVAIDPIALEATGMDKLVWIVLLAIYIVYLVTPEEMYYEEDILFS